jgi:antigen flippase
MSTVNENSNTENAAEPDFVPVPKVPEAPETPQGAPGTYGEILKASALFGGSAALSIVIGIVRTKVFAILLGPAGFGLFGVFGSISNLMQAIAGMGINSSGVRQIAYALSGEDAKEVSIIVTVIRRTSIFLGLFGGVVLAVLARPVAVFTFGSAQHSGAIALLGFSVFFQLISNGQGAIIQGVRRVSDLARMSAWGAVLGTACSIPVVYFLRDRGVVPSLVCVALMAVSVSYWYGRKVDIPSRSLTAAETFRETSALLKLGLVFMSSYLMTMGVGYAVRIIVLRDLGFAATGYYQSAWTLGGLYVGFILQAMGTDFYPRLTALSDDNDACNRLINEQTQVGLLLAGPGVLATLTLAPLVISVFYSARFGAAVGILRWIALGTLVQVITWPLGYMMVAKNRRLLYFASEITWGVVSITLAGLFVGHFGLNGAGIAFFCSNVVSGLLVWLIALRLSSFKWSAANLKTGGIVLSVIAVVFVGFGSLPFWAAISAGIIAVAAMSFYSIRTVIALVSIDRIPRAIRRVLARLGMVSSRIWVE